MRQRVRECQAAGISEEHIRAKLSSGWRLVAVEWEREDAGGEAGQVFAREEVPYGLRVSDDCLHLEENPDEVEVLLAMMEQIVQDRPISKIAQEMNRRGFRNRRGEPWSQVELFRMLPTLVEAGPKLLARKDWPARRPTVHSAA